MITRSDAFAAPDTETAPPVAPALGLGDAVSIIVGIVVGTAVFKTPMMVFSNVTTAWGALGLWLLGGILSFIGALCYAELATTYPRSGGDYHYLTKAFGRWMGFLFGWAQLAVILTGSIAQMAYAFADYGVRLWGADPGTSVATLWLACGSIAVLSVLNLLGVVVGKSVQNVLSTVKVLGLVGIFIAAVAFPSRGGGTWTSAAELPDASLGLALVFVLYAYGGWNDAAFVAAEVRGQRRNLPLALFLGLGLITAVYLLVNWSYLWVLGLDGSRASATPAADLMQQVVGDRGSRLISGLVMISALGAMNGLILTGSRVYASLGADHVVFRRLARWDERRGAPAAALLAQGLIAVLLVLAVGTALGRGLIDATLEAIGLHALPWEKYFGGFESLVSGTAPVFWGFFLLTGVALFVLRVRDAARPRPFATPLFPLPPVIFCGMCVYMLYSSLTYARGLSIVGFLPLALGVPLYAYSRWRDARVTRT
ncbi:MAG: amino acid permease [Pirellulaceae bacterium]|jgi:amino acid transporter|nr:amino acid permease [Pirellulaceae bacterium]